MRVATPFLDGKKVSYDGEDDEQTSGELKEIAASVIMKVLYGARTC